MTLIWLTGADYVDKHTVCSSPYNRECNKACGMAPGGAGLYLGYIQPISIYGQGVTSREWSTRPP